MPNEDALGAERHNDFGFPALMMFWMLMELMWLAKTMDTTGQGIVWIIPTEA